MAVELGEHEINFSSRSAVKGQILVDYLAELPADVEASAKHQDTPAPILTSWELYTDDACSAVGAGAGVILTGPDGEEHTYALRFNFDVTNNEAEYEALLAGMWIAHKLNVKVMHAYVDSKLFEAFQVSHVMRGQNKKADTLSKLAALAFDHLGKRILIEKLHAKSIVMMPLVALVEESISTWMTPLIAFLRDGTLPADSADAKKVRTKAPMYALEGDFLYRRNYLGPHLRCIGPNEAEEVVREVHEGACTLHSGHSDNGTQFAGDPFPSWCAELNIKQTFPSVVHQQANGQCEVTNRDIVARIKARLGHGHIGWVDELPKVLWAHRTMPKASTGETSFSLVYGSEAVVPVEIGVPTFRIQNFDEESNSEALRENLNLLEERRLSAAVKEANNKQKIAKYYNLRVRSRSYKCGDLVLHKNDASHVEDTRKLGPYWEGPYRVVGASNIGACHLATLDGKPVKRTWHATLLKKCYM
ncbi:uncharacterized protein [Rutidosis leptorrhynchoides]|uniref:uncharacterized protein n=1 Tax=Rutidosis leptorrhynchoides TaxID=125765 RepID=UPI003A9A0DBF